MDTGQVTVMLVKKNLFHQNWQRERIWQINQFVFSFLFFPKMFYQLNLSQTPKYFWVVRYLTGMACGDSRFSFSGHGTRESKGLAVSVTGRAVREPTLLVASLTLMLRQHLGSMEQTAVGELHLGNRHRLPPTLACVLTLQHTLVRACIVYGILSAPAPCSVSPVFCAEAAVQSSLRPWILWPGLRVAPTHYTVLLETVAFCNASNEKQS